MALSIGTTVSDITTALEALPPTATDTQRWTAMVTAIYTRIKADMEVNSVIAPGGYSDPAGGTAKAGAGTGSVT